MKELNYSRMAPIIVEILFIIGTVAGILSAVFTGQFYMHQIFLLMFRNPSLVSVVSKTQLEEHYLKTYM